MKLGIDEWRKMGERVSDKGAALAAHPSSQLVVLVLVIGWVSAGGSANAAMLALAIVSITLTQMVLNQQRRRDLALHLKIDELVKAETGARSELAGIEHSTESELEEMRRDSETRG